MKPYNHRIDWTIIEILYEKEKMSAGELNRAVAKRMGLNRPEIEKMTFNFRLKQMTKEESPVIPYLGHSRYVICPVLERDSSLGIGKKFFYSLSENARIIRTLELAILWVEKGNEVKYQLLLLVFLLHNAPIEKVKVKSQTFKSEEEFNNFLTRIHISRRELKPIHIRQRKADALSITTLYDRPNIEIFRVDQIDNLEEGYYTYRLPGTSLNDILNHTQYVGSIPFLHIQLGEGEVKKYLELLERKKLVLPIVFNSIIYLGEIRYEVNGRMLRDFLHQCWSLHEHSILRMRSTWSHYRPPKVEEETWYRIFFGPEISKSHFEKFRFDRKKLKPQRPMHKVQPRLRLQIDDISEYDKEIKRKFDKLLKDHSETIEKYSFFSNMIMQWVYPTFLRNLILRDKI